MLADRLWSARDFHLRAWKPSIAPGAEERTRLFDETPITPMESVGASAQIETTEDQIDPKASLRTEGARPLDETAITPMETVGAPAQL